MSHSVGDDVAEIFGWLKCRKIQFEKNFFWLGKIFPTRENFLSKAADWTGTGGG